MSNTRTTHHLHGAPLKPSIRQINTEATHSNIFNLSYDSNDVTFFISEDESFDDFILSLLVVCQNHLAQKVSP